MSRKTYTWLTTSLIALSAILRVLSASVHEPLAGVG